MKRFFLLLAFLCAQASAQQVFRLEYESQIPAADVAGTIFNATLLTGVKESKIVNVSSGFPTPRLRLAVTTTTVPEVSTRLAVLQVVLLLDENGGTSTYIDSWFGYCDDVSAKGLAQDIASRALKQIEALHSELTKPKT